MSLIPEDALIPRTSLNFAPMVDFLFILIALFALAAVSRKALYDSQVMLVTPHSQTAVTSASHNSTNKPLNFSVSAEGTYKWLDHTSKKSLTFDSVESLKKEIKKRDKEGSTPLIHLHIDKKTSWDPIAQLILAMHEENISVYPVYENKHP